MKIAAYLFRAPRRRAGFSLIDVLIGMAILSIALGSSLALAGNNARLVSRNQNLAAASLLAQNKLEDLRNSTYASIATGADATTINSLGDPSGIFTRSWAVQNNTPMAGMKTIVVTVTWQQWNETRNYNLRGVVAQ
jgi:Tfp pilus assembly protein PilV